MSGHLVVTAGETLGLFSAMSVGVLSPGDRFRFSIGGAESNVAIGLRRLGTPSHWVGRVGVDEIGRAVVAALRSQNVDVTAIETPERPTATMIRTQRLPGRAAVTYQRRGSAGSALAPDDIDADLVARASAIHITGITPALSDSAGATVDRLVELAAGSGTPVSLDVNFRSRLWSHEDAAPRLSALAQRCQLVFAGDDEASLITGCDDLEDQLSMLAAWGVRHAVLKRGAVGASARVDGERCDAPALPIHPRDTVGAGDAFVAGYLHSWLNGTTPLSCLQLANRVAAFQCLADGDWEGMPTIEELGLLDEEEPISR